MRTAVIFTLCLVAGGTTGAQAPATRTPTSMVESFLQRVGKGDYGAGYDELLAGSPMAAHAMQIEALKRQTEAAVPLYGKPLGFELYRQEEFGTSLIRLLYLQRLEKHVLVWKFWLYKPVDAWQVNAVTFNDQFIFE